VLRVRVAFVCKRVAYYPLHVNAFVLMFSHAHLYFTIQVHAYTVTTHYLQELTHFEFHAKLKFFCAKQVWLSQLLTIVSLLDGEEMETVGKKI